MARHRWPIYVCGDGIFISETGDSWREMTNFLLVFTECIRGSGNNDVIVVGDFGATAHFNGSTWTTTFLPNGVYLSVAIKGNLVIAVGSTGSLALVAIGRR